MGLGRAPGRPMRASELFREALRAGVRAAELTDGDVDPTLGSALVALGYDRDFDQLRASSVPAASPPPLRFASVAGWRAIRIDDRAGTVTVPEGVGLDLGATAKALAADHAVTAARAAAGCSVLVSLGGDLSTAGPAPEEGWRVRVTDDHSAGTEAPGQWIVDPLGWPGHLQHHGSPLAGRGARPSITCSIRPPASRCSAVGARPASLPPHVLTPTSPPPRRLCAAPARPAGSNPWGCPAVWSATRDGCCTSAGWGADGDDLPRIAGPRSTWREPAAGGHRTERRTGTWSAARGR